MLRSCQLERKARRSSYADAYGDLWSSDVGNPFFVIYGPIVAHSGPIKPHDEHGILFESGYTRIYTTWLALHVNAVVETQTEALANLHPTGEVAARLFTETSESSRPTHIFGSLQEILKLGRYLRSLWLASPESAEMAMNLRPPTPSAQKWL